MPRTTAEELAVSDKSRFLIEFLIELRMSGGGDTVIEHQGQSARRGQTLTRRRFLAFSGTAVAGALISACSAQSALTTPGASSAPPAATATPALAEDRHD